MKKLGFTQTAAQPTSGDRHSFDAFFNTNLTDNGGEAIDELFPATKNKAGGAAHRALITTT